MYDLTIEIDDETHEKLRRLAAARGMDVDDFATLVVRQVVAKVQADGPTFEESTAGAFAKLRKEAGGGLETDLSDESEATKPRLDRSA